jgi:hypothetical protein
LKRLLYILIIICLGCGTELHAQGDSTSKKADRFNQLAATDSVGKDSVTIVQPASPVIIATDTTALVKADSSVIKRKKVWEPIPKKAGMYSSILPGLGQVYNRQYWKVPIVYGVLGVAGYFIKNNLDEYQTYRKAYINSLDANTTNDEFPQYGPDELLRMQNLSRKNLDILVLLTSVGYALQIMDAVASAHLRNFDISPDISMQMKPILQNNYVGFGLVMNFK